MLKSDLSNRRLAAAIVLIAFVVAASGCSSELVGFEEATRTKEFGAPLEGSEVSVTGALKSPDRISVRGPDSLLANDYLSLIGDFDGDGVGDDAYFRAVGSPNSELELTIETSSSGVLTIGVGNSSSLDRIGMMSRIDRSVETHCGKRKSCAPGEPETIQFQYEGIEVFYHEASSVVYFIENGAIRSVAASD